MSSLDLRGTLKFNANEAENMLLENLGTDPGTTDTGRLYYNTTERDPKIYMGGSFPSWRKIITNFSFSGGDDMRNITYILGSTSSHSILTTEHIFYIDSSATTITMYLPASPISYTAFRFIKSTGAGGDVIINASFNGGTIDGAGSVDIKSPNRFSMCYFDPTIGLGEWVLIYLT